MKLLGLIGGTSWHSTIEYYKLINELAGKRMGEAQNPSMLIYSQNIQLMRDQDKDLIRKTYLEIATKLEKGGAEGIVICANTPHMVYDFVQPKINIPILHIAEAVGKNAKEKGLKTLGLLGNRPTMTGAFFPKYLKENFNIDTVIPDDKYLDQSHHYVSKELTMGKFTTEAKNFYLDQVLVLNKKGAEGIILGCTELPLLVKQEEANVPLISTTDLHAALAVDFIFS
ncbi:aspartate/glutamate racemase family protein [Aquiflexum lacus]|uniref:aspartate/glutamate racemase family protein n=1 Tax=Aquiflexum lacus TaxID=2483805 RepID=UPI001895EEDD|nr:amino acid racemase [Aquiflexum lacus]